MLLCLGEKSNVEREVCAAGLARLALSAGDVQKSECTHLGPAIAKHHRRMRSRGAGWLAD